MFSQKKVDTDRVIPPAASRATADYASHHAAVNFPCPFFRQLCLQTVYFPRAS